MNKYVKSAKISSQGQVTVPKAIRDLLATPHVSFVVEKGEVRIEPVRDMEGALRDYAHKWPKDKSWREVRDEAWQRATRRLLVKKPDAD
jgi:bifunctional DNA-binding transcriptional regulator/antitoxin component of YhaV-PrlF toxin-antitoxin module